jgi:hypothetical protein
LIVELVVVVVVATIIPKIMMLMEGGELWSAVVTGVYPLARGNLQR